MRDEGNVYNITFRDIRFIAEYHSFPWWGRGEGISFTVVPRLAGTKNGRLHDILVENVCGLYAENSIRVGRMAKSRTKPDRACAVS